MNIIATVNQFTPITQTNGKTKTTFGHSHWRGIGKEQGLKGAALTAFVEDAMNSQTKAGEEGFRQALAAGYTIEKMMVKEGARSSKMTVSLVKVVETKKSKADSLKAKIAKAQKELAALEAANAPKVVTA